jgi:hypothetical protein
VLIVFVYKAIDVFLIGSFDPKFGVAGTIELAVFISGMCAAVSSLASAGVFYFYSTYKEIRFSLREITCRTFINGIITSFCYMPLINYAPIINGIVDWPQYIIYFLFLGLIISFISNKVCNKLLSTNRVLKRDENRI